MRCFYIILKSQSKQINTLYEMEFFEEKRMFAIHQFHFYYSYVTNLFMGNACLFEVTNPGFLTLMAVFFKPCFFTFQRSISLEVIMLAKEGFVFNSTYFLHTTLSK